MIKPDRCGNCIFNGVYNRETGEERCYRHYPPMDDFIDDCRIRVPLRRRGKFRKIWKSAYVERTEVSGANLEKLFGEVISMQHMSLKEKKKRAKAFMDKEAKVIEKKGSSILYGTGDEIPPERSGYIRMPTGIPSFDNFLGGGIPTGPIITVYGPSEVGKTSLLLAIAGAAQRCGRFPLWADAEGTLDLSWAKTLGVDTDYLEIISSSTKPGDEYTITAMEDYYNLILKAIKKEIFDIVFLDSRDALIARGDMISKKGKLRDADDDTVAGKARAESKIYPMLVAALRSTNCTLVQVSQMRTKGLGSAFVYDGMSGGNAVQHYTRLRLYMTRGSKSEAPKVSETDIGFALNIKAVRSQISGIPEGSKMQTSFFFGKGFDPVYEYVMHHLSGAPDTVLYKKATSTLYVDKAGTEHVIRGTKPFTVMRALQEQGLIEDFLEQVKTPMEAVEKDEVVGIPTPEISEAPAEAKET